MNDQDYMQIALDLAKQAALLGEVPVGAVVVHQAINPQNRKPTSSPKIIAQAYNLRETSKNPSAHAEFLALLAAAEALGAWRLTDCTVYVTLEPCVMCAGLMHQARISRCVFGAYDKKGGALSSLYNINSDPRLNHNFDVLGGVLQDQCAQILSDFFSNRRAINGKAKNAQR